MQVLSAAPASVLSGAGTFQQRTDMTDNREYTGGSVSYYRVRVEAPLSGDPAYHAECNDIIEALGMNYAEASAFKAIWRSCAARTLGLAKRGYKDGLYDAEKVAFFGGRMVAQAKSAPQLGVEWIENTGVPPFNKGEIEYVLRDGVIDHAAADKCDFAKTGRPSDIIRYRYI